MEELQAFRTIVQLSGAVVSAVGPLLQCMVSLILVGVTGWYAYHTRQISRASSESVVASSQTIAEMAETRMEAAKPVLVLANATYVMSEDPNFVPVDIENIGSGPAFEVIVRVEHLYGYEESAVEVVRWDHGVSDRIFVEYADSGTASFSRDLPGIILNYHDLYGRQWETRTPIYPVYYDDPEHAGRIHRYTARVPLIRKSSL